MRRRANQRAKPTVTGLPGTEENNSPGRIEGGRDFLHVAGPAVDAEGTAHEEAGKRPDPGTVSAILFRRDVEPQEVDLEHLQELIAADDNFVWIDLSAYQPEDVQSLGRLLGIHRRAVRFILAAWQRPGVEIFDNHFLASATVAALDTAASRVQASQLDLIAGRNFLLSAHKQPLAFRDRILIRASYDPELVRLDSAFMLYIILDQLLEHYEDLHERMRIEIEHMQVRALQDSSDDFLEDLLHFKRYTFALSQLVEQHETVFAAFLRPDFPFVSGDQVVDYFRELEARLARFVDRLAAARQEVNGAFDIYVSHQAHRTNHQMKVLTMVATLLLPASLIVSFFGTNFPELPLNTVPAFAIMILSIAIVSLFLLMVFRRQGWM